MSVPLSSRWVAKLCRSVWTVTRLLSPQAALAEQLRREHHVAVPTAFALLDADCHAAAVDVGDLDAGGLGGTQPRRICRGQRGTGLQA
jgi:hypothetical protein